MVTCEVVNNEKEFKFRLVSESEKTLWCTYTMVAYLDGKVAATQYYVPQSHECRPITPDEFCQFIASGVKE